MSAPAVPGREPLDLTSYLGHQRWFAGKGRAWQVTGTATVGRPSADVRIDTVTVTYDDGDTETYLLPLVAYDSAQEHLAHAFVGEEVDPNGARRHLYDALHDKDATVHWIDGIAMDSLGNIYTGEVDDGKRVQKFVLQNGDGVKRFRPHD